MNSPVHRCVWLLAAALPLASAIALAGDAPAPAPRTAAAVRGRSLFLKNCAHCHGDDARGDEGPDLHGLHRSDEWLGRRIRSGIKGEMPAFGEKFNQDDVNALIAFLHTLH